MNNHVLLNINCTRIIGFINMNIWTYVKKLDTMNMDFYLNFLRFVLSFNEDSTPLEAIKGKGFAPPVVGP